MGNCSARIGADYAWDRPPVAALKAAGIQFVCRYLSPDATKNLTRGEAALLLSAGISVVVVWEGSAVAMLRGYAGGVADAQAADVQARGCGMAGAVIYFAADWDATPDQQAQINAYLDGAASIIGRDSVGMYGGYWALSRARDARKATYWWGTVAWSGSNWATCGWLPHIMQGGLVVLGGAECDWDVANFDDYGQWPRPAPDPVDSEETGMIMVSVDPKSVPAGKTWPGDFLLFDNGTLGHITPATDSVNNVASYTAAGIKGPVIITYGEYVARGGK
jgi:glycoside hydrolase-like protein